MFARRAATGKFVESGITADEIRVPRACFEYAFNPSLSLSFSAPVVWSYPHREFLGISLCTAHGQLSKNFTWTRSPTLSCDSCSPTRRLYYHNKRRNASRLSGINDANFSIGEFFLRLRVLKQLRSKWIFIRWRNVDFIRWTGTPCIAI